MQDLTASMITAIRRWNSRATSTVPASLLIEEGHADAPQQGCPTHASCKCLPARYIAVRATSNRQKPDMSATRAPFRFVAATTMPD
jgi:hypothetical protein